MASSFFKQFKLPTHQIICSALIVEPRQHPGLAFTLNNIRRGLGSGVPIYWIHGNTDSWANLTNVHYRRLVST